MRLGLFCLAPMAFVLVACQGSGGLASNASSSVPGGSGASVAASASAMASASSGASSSGFSAGGFASGDCGAAQFQNLVGTSGDAVNRGNLPSGTRVLRPTTPMSPDYRPGRLNVYIDASGQVEKVVCG